MPVPLSPVMSTVVSSGATFWTRLTTAFIEALVPVTNSSSWAWTWAVSDSTRLRRS